MTDVGLQRAVAPTPGDADTVPSFSVVICAYSDERWANLVAAVASVREQSHPAQEIIVVIDHNERLMRRADACLAGAVVIASEGAPGLSGARNSGLHRASAEVLAFLDDDACAAPDWLEQLAGALRNERVIGLGGWIEPRWEGPEPRWLAPELYWIVGCSYRGLPPAGSQIRNPIGANMAFRRAQLQALGGFREGVGRIQDRPLGDEETQVGIEAHARWPEARIVHAPAARVQHAVPPTRATWRYLLVRSWSEGRSKAQLSGNVGASSALASERVYSTRVLPAGVARAIADAIGGDMSGLGRAASIVLAFGVTAFGYLFGRLRALEGP